MHRITLTLLGVLMTCSVHANELHFSGIMPSPLQGEYGDALQIETKLPRAGKIWALDWSPDGKYIAIGSRAGQIRVYNSQSLTLVAIFPGLKGDVNGIAWSPDSTQIAASGSWQDPRVVVWNFETGVMHTVGKHQRQVRDVQWSPDGSFLASSSHDGKINIWKQDGSLVKTFKGAVGGYVSIDWRDNDILVASGWDNTIRVYSVRNGDGAIFTNGELGKKAVLSVDWHPSGDLVATGDYGNDHDPDHLVKLWSADGKLLNTLRGHKKEIRALAWNLEGSILATGGESIRLWKENGEPIMTFEHEGHPIWSMDWSPDGNFITSGDGDGNLIIWNLLGKKVASLQSHSSTLISSEFSVKGSRLFLGFSNGQIRAYDFPANTTSTHHAHQDAINDIALTHYGEYIALASNDRTGSIWKTTGSTLSKIATLSDHQSIVSSAAWGPNERYLATGGYQSPVMVWDPTGIKIREHKTELRRVTEIQWDKDTPIPYDKEPKVYGVAGVPVQKDGDNLLLVPLTNNKFALFDRKGKLVWGDPKDFVYLERSKKETISLAPYDLNKTADSEQLED